MFSARSGPSSQRSCLMASRKGWLSMSPIVPPISVMQNEGGHSPSALSGPLSAGWLPMFPSIGVASLPAFPSLGAGPEMGRCSIRRLISSVMWGTTCMVLPK